MITWNLDDLLWSVIFLYFITEDGVQLFFFFCTVSLHFMPPLKQHSNFLIILLIGTTLLLILKHILMHKLNYTIDLNPVSFAQSIVSYNSLNTKYFLAFIVKQTLNHIFFCYVTAYLTTCWTYCWLIFPWPHLVHRIFFQAGSSVFMVCFLFSICYFLIHKITRTF